jgi:Bifunctional DNA primase/polymerase, N-terminal/Primase C terminal 1 (PriCT-1)
MIGAALALASRGMAVFPLKPRDKIPITKHGCKDATVDLEVVSAWWEGYPEANIGLATGARSGVWVVDIDGELGEASLHALEQRMGVLPATVESITGGGGRHLFFRLPDSDEVPTIKNTARKIGEGLDTRGDGGYVVAPPSIHPRGRAYAWSVDSAAEFADPPVWLVAMIIAPVVRLDERQPPEHWTQLAHDGAEEGARNMTLASMAGRYLRLGIHPAEVNELLLGWNASRNRPPLPDAEVTRVVTSIAAKEFERKGNYNG